MDRRTFDSKLNEMAHDLAYSMRKLSNTQALQVMAEAMLIIDWRQPEHEKSQYASVGNSEYSITMDFRPAVDRGSKSK